jgi:hypothetical protein
MSVFLHAARNGAALTTRSGRPVRFVAYLPRADHQRQIVVSVDGHDCPVTVDINGRFISDVESAFDVLVVEVQHGH